VLVFSLSAVISTNATATFTSTGSPLPIGRLVGVCAAAAQAPMIDSANARSVRFMR